MKTTATDFWNEWVIATDADLPRAVFAADFDGDGDMDALAASAGDGKLAWYENRGGGEHWPERIIAVDADKATSVRAADLDGDGDFDVLAAADSSGKIAWHENLGAGAFSPRRDITANGERAREIHLADLDGDNDFDVLSISGRDNRIIWYRNEGAGVFSAQRTVTADADGVISVGAADVDGDGDLDVLAAFPDEDRIAWYSNQGGERFSPPLEITADADRVGNVHAADLDVRRRRAMCSGPPRITGTRAWFENLGGGEFASHRAIATSLTSFVPADLDGDGDLDILVDSGDYYGVNAAWMENLGGGELSSRQVFTEQVRAHIDAGVADLDGDGDLDILLMSLQHDSSRSLDWYENQGGGNFLAHQIDAGDLRISSSQAADIDGDGDLDVYAPDFAEGGIAFYENLGRGVFSSRQVLAPETDFAAQTHVADMDGDSDIGSDIDLR